MLTLAVFYWINYFLKLLLPKLLKVVGIRRLTDINIALLKLNKTGKKVDVCAKQWAVIWPLLE